MGTRPTFSDFLNKGFRLNGNVLEKVEQKEKKVTPIIQPPSVITAKQFNEIPSNRVILNIDPTPKLRMTIGDRSKHRPAVQRYWDYKAKLDRLAGEVNFVLGDTLDIEFHIPMPKGWDKDKKFAMNGRAHQERPDIDNLCKAFFDCLVKSDQHIWNIKAVKVWSYMGKIIINPN